jgi:predicted O-methyltransferase YrrM
MENTNEILDKLEKESMYYGIPILGPEKGQLVRELIQKHQPKNLLEIGTSIGYSAVLTAQSMPENSKLTTIEVNHDYTDHAQSFIIEAGLENKIKVMTGNALEIIPKLNENFDFVLIDGAKDQFWFYLDLLEPKLNSGAIIVANNVKLYSTQVKDYLDHVLNSGKFENSYHEFNEDAMEVSIKK